jgi:three-Cys-motif partner protein
MARYWGFWTRGKLDLLRRYLDAFTTASKGQREIIYLDLFGGQPDNRDRLTYENLDGSARIALGTTDARFTRLRFFEIEPYASRLRAALTPDYPDRDFHVISGDCNQTVAGALRELAPYDWAPTFALVDPNGPDVHWSTLEALAGFKQPHLTKVELWVLLAAGMFIRTLPRDGRVRPEDAEKLTQMYGTEQWRAIYEARVIESLSPADAREEYVNLMRWRLQHVLGYQRTHPLEIFNERGHPIYHMIFATDHPAGDRIMTDLYNAAADEFPRMRQDARLRRARLAEQEAGVQSLFDDDTDLATAPRRPRERLYIHSEPWLPYGTSDPELQAATAQGRGGSLLCWRRASARRAAGQASMKGRIAGSHHPVSSTKDTATAFSPRSSPSRRARSRRSSRRRRRSPSPRWNASTAALRTSATNRCSRSSPD